MIDVRRDVPLRTEDVIRVFDDSGLIRPTDDPDRITRMFAASNLVVSAWDGGVLVGVARALTDFSYCCYLSDLAVAKSHQRQGVGKRLVVCGHGPGITHRPDIFCGIETESRRIAESADLTLAAGPTPAGAASTIVDTTSGEPRIVRQGPIPAEAIAALAR